MWNLTTERLDSAYGWLPWPDTLPPAPLTLLSDPCQPPENKSLEGQVALALLPDAWSDSPECSLAEIVRNAQVGYYTCIQGTYHVFKIRKYIVSLACMCSSVSGITWLQWYTCVHVHEYTGQIQPRNPIDRRADAVSQQAGLACML